MTLTVADQPAAAAFIPVQPSSLDRSRRYASGFRPDVEGLRALSVLTVLAFHAGVPHLLGGFVGVDVFFVISGFLITAQMLHEIAVSGGLSLPEFYARRARRILPSAGVALVATALGSWLLLDPLRRLDVAYDLLSAAANVGNWRFIANQTNYLAVNRAPSPVLHYWSLGVEEQFYLVWPTVLLLLVVLARRRRWPLTPLVLGVILSLGVVSFFLCLRWTSSSVSLAYMGSPSRAWEFAIGALVALASGVLNGRPLPSWFRFALGWVGTGSIGYAAVTFSNSTPFPGTAALWPSLGVAALLLAGFGPRTRGFASHLLGVRPLREVGRLSFALYLWHWPVLILAEARFGELSWPVKLGLVLSGIVPAWLSMRLVEKPLRFSKIVSAAPRNGLSVGVVAVLLPAVLALAIGSDVLRQESAITVRGAFLHSADSGVLSARQTRSSGPVNPSPLLARTDFPHFPAECQVDPQGTDSPSCMMGSNSGSAGPVVLLGDSHAGMWFPLAKAAADERNVNVEILAKSGCPLESVEVINPSLGRVYTECDVWRTRMVQRLTDGPRPSLIIIASLNRYVELPEAQVGWHATLTALRAVKSPIVYVEDTPFPGKDIPACLSGNLGNWPACSFSASEGLRVDPVSKGVGMGSEPGITVISANRILCPETRCPAVVNGILLYRDTSHLTNMAAGLLSHPLLAELDKALRFR